MHRLTGCGRPREQAELSCALYGGGATTGLELGVDVADVHADVIVSGLPWAAFAAAQQDDLLGAVTGALAPGGVFTTFAYTHTRWVRPARRLRRSLAARFEEVVPARTVWANLPPAFVYFCRRPVHSPAGRASHTATDD